MAVKPSPPVQLSVVPSRSSESDRSGGSAAAASSLPERRLLSAADRAGDANGVATPGELQTLSGRVCVGSHFDHGAAERAELLARIVGSTGPEGHVVLDEALRAMPRPMRLLALELDGVWGNADGSVSSAELDRVANYYLAALPFFRAELDDLLKLADALGLDGEALGIDPCIFSGAPAAKTGDRTSAAFRALFDEAVAHSDIPGAPELLRDALKHSPRWHRLSILEHSAFAVRAVKVLSRVAGLEWTDAGAAMLLHDVGKIVDRQSNANGGFTFHDHEGTGARWLKDRGLPEEMVFQIQNHSMLRRLSVEDLWSRAGGDPDRLARMIVVYIADQVAKGDTPGQLASFSEQKPKLEALCALAGLDAQALFTCADVLRNEVVRQAERAEAALKSPH